MEQKRVQELKELFKNFSNSIIAEQVCIFEDLLQTDEMNHCLLVDDFMLVYDMLRDECARRICILAETEN